MKKITLYIGVAIGGLLLYLALSSFTSRFSSFMIDQPDLFKSSALTLSDSGIYSEAN